MAKITPKTIQSAKKLIIVNVADNERDKIEVKDEYDFRIFVRKRITNVTAEYQLPQFDDFDEFAEYVKCFTPDGRFPGL